MSDQHEIAPDTVVTGPVWDLWPTIQQAIKQVQAGVYTAQDYGTFSFMAKGGATLAPLYGWEQKLPPDVLNALEEKKAAIESGRKKIEWGSQVRNYVFQPYTLVKDTRTGFETGDVQAVMDGEIDDFIKAFLMEYASPAE